METAHLVTEVNVEKIDTEDIYDEEGVETSVNEVLGANNSLEQSARD